MLFVEGATAWCDNSRGAQCDGTRIEDYWIDATPVTREAYAKCVAAQSCSRSSYPDQPTSFRPHDEILWQNGVTFDQASKYCRWRKARLPKEPEWNQAFLTAKGHFVPVHTTSGNEGEWVDGHYHQYRLKLVELEGGSYRFGGQATTGAAGTGFRCAKSPEQQPPSQAEASNVMRALPQTPPTEPEPVPHVGPERAAGRALVVLGQETVSLDPGTHIYDRICVQDNARIAVRGSTTIVLNSSQTTVIGGRGIGPVADEKASIRIETQLAPEMFILFDNARAPIDVDLNARRSKVSVAITGKTGLVVGGTGAETMQSFGGWGLPTQFPACGVSLDRETAPTFPPSTHRPQNCVGAYRSSNYAAEPDPGQGADLHVIGVYEGRQHTGGAVEVYVNEAAKPVVLALSAYQPTTWKIAVGPQVVLRDVYVSGYNAQTVKAPSQARVHESKLGAYAYGWEAEANTGGGSYSALIRAVRKLTGLHETSFQGCYAGSRFDVPQSRSASSGVATERWKAFAFKYDRAQSACSGGARYVLYREAIAKWVGVELCSSNRYKIFAGEARDGVFHEIGDFSGHGQDHCELVNPSFTLPNEDDMTSGGCAACAVQMAGWGNPGPVPVYTRNRVGEPLKLQTWPEYNLYTSVWYECGVSIP